MNIKNYFEVYYEGAKNFITPKVYGYDYKDYGDFGIVLEKSYGDAIFGDGKLYGASFLYVNFITNEVQKIDICKAFGSSREIEEYFKSITMADVIEADKYGEIKVIPRFG